MSDDILTPELEAALTKLCGGVSAETRELNRAFDHVFAAISKPLNAETVLGNKPVAGVIDLQQRFDITYSEMPNGEWCAIDRVSFDPDPEARMHLMGYGPSTGEALTDLLEKIADVAAQG